MGRSRIVVVGAGVSGLAAAHRLAKSAAAAGRDLDVLVLERGAQVGGKARTLHEGGFRIETGPTSYLDNSEPFREPTWADQTLLVAGLISLAVIFFSGI